MFLLFSFGETTVPMDRGGFQGARKKEAGNWKEP
jgi:hypothetical protein